MITLDSIGDFKVSMTQLTLIKAVRIMADSQITLPLKRVHNFILKVTNLDEQHLTKISLQDAIFLVVYYRMQFSNTFPIVEHPRILASDLIHSSENKGSLILIGEFRFNSQIPLLKAIEAEQIAYSRGDSHILSFYIIAMSCLKGFELGWKTLIEMKDDEHGRGQIVMFNQSFNEGKVKLDLLREGKEGNRITKSLSLIAGGAANNAVGFHASNLLSYGI
jgi:hypothetical protein